VPYGVTSEQILDFSIPAAQGFPTVLFVHGGGLTSGDKSDNDYRNFCTPFATIGIGCANMNYRLGPAHVWPAQAEDVASAVAWLLKNVRGHGGDSTKVFLVGHSSGAMLVSLVSTDDRYLARRGLSRKDLRGVVSMGSIMWDVDLEKAIGEHGRDSVERAFSKNAGTKLYESLEAYLDQWPFRHIRAGLPPMLFLIAESEQQQPPVLLTNRKFVDTSRSHGNWAEYRILRGRTHYTAVRRLSEPDDAVFIMLRDFIREFAA
jgi:acetyl esterase/lipase